MPIERWSNWIGNHQIESDVIAPGSLEELCKEVKSRSQVGRIRPAGNSYSWAPLIPNKDTIIRMHRLSRLIDLNAEAMTLEVECGMTIQHITKLCAEAGLAVISPTLFPQPQLGGAIATGSHGTGFGVAALSDSILEMTIIQHDGTPKVIKDTDPDFDAAKVALGTFGIIYSVKLQLEKNYAIYTDKILVPVEAVLEGFPDLLATSQYLEMFWYPLQSHFWVYLMDRTDSAVDKKTWLSELREKVSTWVQNTGGNYLTPWIAQNMPSLTPMINKAAIRMSDTAGATVRHASDAFHFQKAYPKNWDSSYSIPAQHASEAWRRAIDLVTEYGDQGLYPVNFALHCRFTGASKTWLAADHGRETLFIECATAYGTPHIDEFYGQLQDRWFDFPMARPHWAKLYDTGAEIFHRYERMPDFLDVREKWDPDRIFLNNFLEDTVFHLNDPAYQRAGRAPVLNSPVAAPLGL
ncbi:MAG: FAD/FMN-containing dehydrogenase [Myxococcota bacterium]|jgi:FAD/FMN-containing dehydrogenase